jgi:hypothetical protein
MFWPVTSSALRSDWSAESAVLSDPISVPT